MMLTAQTQVAVPTGSLYDKLHFQLWFCFWAERCLTYRAAVRLDELEGSLRNFTWNKHASATMAAWARERPYGLAFYTSTVLAWRMCRYNGQVSKGIRLIQFGEHNPILKLGPSWGVVAAPPEVQRYAFTFFRTAGETQHMLRLWQLRRALNRKVQLPFDRHTLGVWWTEWHPTDPVCLATPGGNLYYVCTPHGYWPMLEAVFRKYVLPAPRGLAVLNAFLYRSARE